MQTERSIFIYSSIEYLVCFLIFMLIESYANTRVGEVIGAPKVGLFYGIFILFTAAGFLFFGVSGKIDSRSKGLRILPVIICMITVGMFCCVNVPIILIIGAAGSLLSMGYLGGRIMYRMAVSYSEIKYPGTVVGFSMAVAIIMQYVMQTLIQTNLLSVISFEIILVVLLALELNNEVILLSNDEKATEDTIILDGEEFYISISDTDYAAILEPGDYVLAVYAEIGSKTYSFNSYTSAVPAITGVDTMAEEGWSVSGETVTINNLNVNSGDYAEFCIWSGDKENAGYGKGTAKLVIKGNCFIKTLVIDCPVEVTCESGAQLAVGELVVNTDEGADGKLTYAGGTTYNAATKTFEVVCAHTNKTESVEKLPKKEPVKGDVIKDENTGATCKVLDDKKNEVSYVAPASKNASKLSVPKTIKIDGKIYKVVSIDAKAFKNNKNLKTLTLPATVVKIGANTFAGCKKLKTIKITSKKLTSKTVAKNAFKGLSKTTTIKVPKKQLKAYKKLLKKKGFKGKVK